MAIYNLKVSPAKGRSAVNKFEYIGRVNNFSWEKVDKYDDFVYSENCNMPLFAQENPIEFWKKCEEHERMNSNLFREIEFSLIHELSVEENIELATKFAQDIFNKDYVYSLAVHSKKSNNNDIENIHCHIMFSERKLDGIKRNSELFFRRFNPKNAELGGARKNEEWNKFSKLYEIRQKWEEIANKKLKEKNLELISSKSLKDQRIDSLLEENYLKAEMLDRPPVGYNANVIRYSTNDELKNDMIEFNNYAKKIKEMKEKEFKILSENFDVENEKAKERFIKSLYEKEGKEYVPSDFDITENIKKEQFNFENIFITSLENQVLINKKENTLKKINALTKEDKTNRALKILTKGKYAKNLNELENLNGIYSQLADKSKFPFTDRKLELENYFDELKTNEHFNIKLKATIENIDSKYKKSKELLLEDLEFLRKNKFIEMYKKYSPEKLEISKTFMKETTNSIKDLKINKKIIDTKISNYKELLNKDYRVELYREINPILVDKYNELKKWRVDLNNISNNQAKTELEIKIATREMSFNILDIKNNIDDKLTMNLKQIRSEYKTLRQEQDSIQGKINLSSHMIKELKNLKEFKILDDIKSLEESYRDLEKNGSNLDKLKYNIQLEKLDNSGKKLDINNSSKLKKFIVSDINKITKKEYSSILKKEIIQLKKEIENSNKQLSKLINIEENIKDRIYDKYTNGEYSKEKNYLKSYELRIKNGYDSLENKIMLESCKDQLKEFENNYKITEEQIKLEKQIIRNDFIDTRLKLINTKENLSNSFKLLKELNKDSQIKSIKRNYNKLNLPRKLKVIQTGRIDFEDQEKIKRKQREWENSFEL